MAFPGTYNFAYYKGDTLQFKIYPKDASGAIFDISGFTDLSFTIANKRGITPANIQSTDIVVHAMITPYASSGYVLCTIRPEDGNQLVGGSSYVYDVEIKDTSGSYPLVYTILTGTITVTEQVTAASRVALTIPQSLSVTIPTSGSVALSWTKPDQGSPAGYYLGYASGASTPLGTLTAAVAPDSGAQAITFTASTNLAVGNIVAGPGTVNTPNPTVIVSVDTGTKTAVLSQALSSAGSTTTDAYAIIANNIAWLGTHPITDPTSLGSAIAANKITVLQEIVSTTSKTITGLTHNTPYEFFIAATYDTIPSLTPTFGPVATITAVP